MPVNTAQLLAGANYTLESFAKNDPIDQFTSQRPLTEWLVKNRIDSVFGNGIFNEKVRITNASNYQSYQGDDQVSYNKRDTVRKAPFYHYDHHDGFALNETELADNGISMTDDRDSVVTDYEMQQIVNKLTENYAVLKDGFQEKMDLELHRDGSLSATDCPGLDLLVSTTPATTTVGGIDCSLTGNEYWENQVNTGISTASAGNLTDQMEKTWRACITKGKMGAPDFLVCGSKFLDAYRIDAGLTINRQIIVPGKGGTNLDASVSGVFFKGVPLVWDPSMDTLQASDDPTVDWDKRCYFLNSKALNVRPFKGRWMVQRKPDRVYDRYTHYFGQTADFGFTVKQRNALAVLSIA